MPSFITQKAWGGASLYFAKSSFGSYFNKPISLRKARWGCKMSWCWKKNNDFSKSLYYTIHSSLLPHVRLIFRSKHRATNISTSFSKVLNIPILVLWAFTSITLLFPLMVFPPAFYQIEEMVLCQTMSSVYIMAYLVWAFTSFSLSLPHASTRSMGEIRGVGK